jgi:hypothetical protein
MGCEVALGPNQWWEACPVLSGYGWEVVEAAGLWRVQALTESDFALSAVLVATSVINICCSLFLRHAPCLLPGKQDCLALSQRT